MKNRRSFLVRSCSYKFIHFHYRMFCCRFIHTVCTKSYYADGSYKSSDSSDQEASDVLSEILKNLPHKPMKTVVSTYSSDNHSFNQIPIPNDFPPPFKPLNDHPNFDFPYKNSISVHSEYGLPNQYPDYSAQASEKRPIAVNPKAYDIYHSLKVKMAKEKNFVTLPTLIDLLDPQGLEIQQSIGYEIKA